MKSDQRAVRPASRFFVVPAAVLLIIPLIPFTVVSALLSGAALIMALREPPGRARIISTVAAALLFVAAILLTIMAVPTGTTLLHNEEVTPT
ncbi:MAG: hypothetical protein JWO49_1232 [Arthrobacter sp.]|nr:hypothetical protein [Arthrobacter sp.]